MVYMKDKRDTHQMQLAVMSDDDDDDDERAHAKQRARDIVKKKDKNALPKHNCTCA